ncbi:MAG: tetratricopeptide repeat protein [Mucilaginibacter sp.]|uniref:tetratricopeptide repeat protein n=1 Tax=Mucilaginibacter sp. TaxID=1882438 RepID=UPI0031ADA80B
MPSLAYTERLLLTNPDSAFVLIQELRIKFSGKEHEHSLAICYQQLGRILHNQSAYAQALAFFIKANRIFAKEEDQRPLAQNLNYIGRTYSSARLKEKATGMYEEALKIFQKYADNKGIAQTYSLLGEQYVNRRSSDISYHYQTMALQAYLTIKDSSGIARVYENIGEIYEIRKQYATALDYFKRALSIEQTLNNRAAQIGIINNIGDIYRKTGSLAVAVQTTMEAKNLAEHLKFKRLVLSAYDDLAKTYKLMGNLDSAYYYSECSSKTYHETFKEESSKQINLLQTLFEVEKKDHEVAQLKEEKKVNIILASLTVLVLLLFCLLGLSYYSKQQLKNRDEKIILETQKGYMQIELENKRLQEKSLNEELEIKSKELTTHTLHIIQKNQQLDNLKSQLNAIVKNGKRDQRTAIKEVIDSIDMSNNQDKSWNDFRIIFEKVHQNFFDNLKKHACNLTAADMRLVALLKMNLGSADIATMIGISQDSLRTTKYRLRQKLQIPEGGTLTNFIQQL